MCPAAPPHSNTTQILPPITTVRIKYNEFVARHGKQPTKITMHPRVLVDLVETLKPAESLMLDHWTTPGKVYLHGMLVVEDPNCPGIEMILE